MSGRTCSTDRQRGYKHAGGGTHAVGADHQDVSQHKEQDDGAVVELELEEARILQGLPQMDNQPQRLGQGCEEDLQPHTQDLGFRI